MERNNWLCNRIRSQTGVAFCKNLSAVREDRYQCDFPTPRDTVLLGKQIVSQLVKKFPALRKPQFQHRIHKSWAWVPNLSQSNPIIIFTLDFPKIHFNSIFESTPRILSFPLLFPYLYILPFLLPHSSHLSVLSQFLCPFLPLIYHFVILSPSLLSSLFLFCI